MAHADAIDSLPVQTVDRLAQRNLAGGLPAAHWIGRGALG